MEQSQPKILIVDDDPAIRRLVRKLLCKRYDVSEAEGGQQAIGMAKTSVPDLVLLDISMPDVNGYEVCRFLKQNLKLQAQIIMVSGKSKEDALTHAFECGADDYLVKPFDPTELRSRVELHARLRESQAMTAEIQREVDCRHAEMKRVASERAEEIVAIQDVAVFTLAKVAESRDGDTGEHISRMREYSQRMALELAQSSVYSSQIDEQFLADLYRSSPLHDIGKVAIPDAILLKPGRLTTEEFEHMKTHTVVGAEILNEAVMQLKGGGFLAMGAVIARSHHEWWNGKGYPDAIAGAEIPLPARIVSVADVYDALTSERPYKHAWTPEDAKRTIDESSGTQFDPRIVEAFDRCFNDILEIQMKFSDHGCALFSPAPATPVSMASTP